MNAKKIWEFLKKDIDEKTIYVKVLNSSTQNFRPVLAKSRKYSVIIKKQSVPAGEIWEFAPGQAVKTELKKIDGVERLVATADFSPGSSAYMKNLKRDSFITVAVYALVVCFESLHMYRTGCLIEGRVKACGTDSFQIFVGAMTVYVIVYLISRWGFAVITKKYAPTKSPYLGS
jgi:hypothetical protein